MGKFAASTDPFRQMVSLYFGEEVDDDFIVATPVHFKTVEEGIAFEPFMKIRIELAQSLADALWDAGIIPNRNNAEPPSEKHLQDMRKIAFDLLEEMKHERRRTE